MTAQSSADIRAALLGRPLTAVERAADDHSDWLRERDAAELAAFLAERQQHAAWRAQWKNGNYTMTLSEAAE
jgi:hypothetical protein